MPQFYILQPLAWHTVNTQDLNTTLNILFYHSFIHPRCHSVVVAEYKGVVQLASVRPSERINQLSNNIAGCVTRPIAFPTNILHLW